MGVEGFRLSPQQKQLWELERHPPTYCAQCAIMLKGPLERKALKDAIQTVVDRHEILRTTFEQRAGLKVPIQLIAGAQAIFWNEMDLQHEDETDRAGSIERILKENRGRSFDYEKGPLIDLLLLRLKADEHILSIRLPVMCADAKALANLVQEIATLLHPERAESVEEDVVQYLQFSEWQNELCEHDESKLGLEFWQERIEEICSPPQLPFLSNAGNGDSFEPSSISISIGSELTNQMESVATDCETDLSTFLLACLQMLIWRLTGQSDIVVAYTLDGRKFEELQKGIGFFARTVPFTTRFDEDLRFFDVLRKAGQEVKKYKEWQEFFVSAGEDNEMGKKYISPVAFEYLDWPTTVMTQGLGVFFYNKYVCWDRFQIKLSCLRRGDSLITELLYDRDWIREEDAESLAGQFRVLMGKAAATPFTRISELEILTDEERKRVIAFNNTSRAGLAEKTVCEMFEEQASKTPSAIAVVFEDHYLSYAQLNRRANGLAHRLQELGVGPEVPVTLLLDRSLEAVISLLAILKAGGAYVPLDPALPQQRLSLLLQETGSRMVITQERFVESLAGTSATLIVLDRECDETGSVDANPDKHSIAENLAYILFTSGSTGKPKGVMVENRQLSNYVQGLIEKLREPETSNFAMVSTFAADLGNTVLFPSLCAGGCLHLLSQEVAFDVDAFADYFRNHEIDYLKIVPSHFSNVLKAISSAEVIPRKMLILGGEASDWDLIDRISELSPDCRILNHYGPTETTVGVMTHELQSESVRRCEGGMPLGRPLPNSRAYILDDLLRLTPTGVPGGLYIGGKGLSRGYLNHPEFTAEKFIPDPMSREAGERLYQTGDVAKFLPDGSVKFLGRRDHQVKIRGFRVELGEIEALLRQHPAVRNTVVDVREFTPGVVRLAAYIVPNSTSLPAEAELHSLLKQSLPDYMLPTAYVLLENLPLTPNGKVDRNSLPAPDKARVEQIGMFVPPCGVVEELLASIWKEVLSVEQLSKHDSFLRLGGDSLLATQLVSRVRKTFQVELPVQSIFDAPTISEFAVVVERAMQGSDKLEIPPITPVPRNGHLPLSFPQEGLWSAQQLDPESSAYNSCAFECLNGPLNVEMFRQALDEIVRRHEILRMTCSTVDEHPVLVISPPAPVFIDHIHLDTLPEAEQEDEIQRIVVLEKNLPFDLGEGPLLRVKLLRLNPEKHVLLLTLHHIVTDRWSFSIFVRELSILYDSFCQGLPSPLPELQVQYADFAHWQRQVFRGEVLKKLLSYWTQQLMGAPEVINLPTDYSRPQIQSFKGDAIFSYPSPQLLASLNDLGRKEGTTLFMTLLAAFYTLLYHYTGREDIVVGTDAGNRNRFETENLIGCFVNNLVLRADLAGNPTFRELLAHVRKRTLEAYAHQDLPFATLVKALRVKRSLSHTPLFQVHFALQNTPARAFSLSSLQVEGVETEYITSKFDLAVSVTETKNNLMMHWSYSTELFKPETISRMSLDFNNLLESIVNQPDARLSKLKISHEGKEKKRSQKKWGMRSQRS